MNKKPGKRPSIAPPPSRDASLAKLATQQHGVVSAAQLREIGLDSKAGVRRLHSGRMVRVHPLVYAVGHGALSQEGRWMAAVLSGGEGAVVSHLTAAGLWRVWRRAVGPHTDITSPRRRRPRDHVRVHLCRNLDPRDVTSYQRIPVTTVARTLVDLSDVLDAHRLANVIHEAAFRRHFDVRATRQAMARANGRRRLAVLEAALALHAAGCAGTRSELEDRFLALIRAHGLPEPLVNVGVSVAGRSIELDFHWPELMLCAEIDGHGHLRPRTRRQDAVRDELLRGAGYRVLRFAGHQVARESPDVLVQLRRALS